MRPTSISMLSSIFKAFPNSTMNWKRLANCHMFRRRCSMEGCLDAWDWALSESSSWRERLRAVGMVGRRPARGPETASWMGGRRGRFQGSTAGENAPTNRGLMAELGAARRVQ